MNRFRARFTILTLLVFVVFCATIFAIVAARPSRTIKVTVHSNGSFTCEAGTYPADELKPMISDAISTRKRWFVEPRAQIQVEPGVDFAKVPKIMHAVASAGCEDVQLGLPSELSSKLSMPGLTSKPWQD